MNRQPSVTQSRCQQLTLQPIGDFGLSSPKSPTDDLLQRRSLSRFKRHIERPVNADSSMSAFYEVGLTVAKLSKSAFDLLFYKDHAMRSRQTCRKSINRSSKDEMQSSIKNFDSDHHEKIEIVDLMIYVAKEVGKWFHTTLSKSEQLPLEDQETDPNICWKNSHLSNSLSSQSKDDRRGQVDRSSNRIRVINGLEELPMLYPTPQNNESLKFCHHHAQFIPPDPQIDSVQSLSSCSRSMENKFWSPVDSLLGNYFSKKYWKQKEIRPIKEKLQEGTLWQKVWHILDSRTYDERRKRHMHKILRIGKNVVTRQKWNPNLLDIPKQSWNYIYKSHLELSIFSVENVPFIGQIILETSSFRVAMPFNCLFLKIPIPSIDDILTIWFNSPVEKSQRCSKNYTELSDECVDWIGNQNTNDDDEDIPDHEVIDEDDFDETELQQFTESIHERSIVYKMFSLHQYTPQFDYPTYFRLDIPISVIQNEISIEDSFLIDPKGTYHDVNTELSPNQKFNQLRKESKVQSRHPMTKLSLKCRHNGIVNALTTRDTCSVEIRTVYVSQIDDPLDEIIGQFLNSHPYLLEEGVDLIIRLSYGKYLIRKDEVDISLRILTLEEINNFDFTEYQNDLRDEEISIPIVITDDYWQPLKDHLL